MEGLRQADAEFATEAEVAAALRSGVSENRLTNRHGPGQRL